MEFITRTVISCFIFVYCINSVVSQGIITPPPPGVNPVEANGRLYNLFYVPRICKDPWVMVQSEFSGGGIVITGRKVLMQKYGPYHVQGNIEIAPKGCLVIMPGVEMYFGVGYGIIVNGTLIARGSYLPNQRILMTKNPNSSLTVGSNGVLPDDARLVDGNTTRDGRLDLLWKGKWRGVCTNYNNFTEIDLNVTCRHLGFAYGNFTYHSFTRNETDYMVFEKPACRGTENSLFECPGRANIKDGARVCDGQQVVGFECAGLRPDLAKDHWRGIEFYNATLGEISDGNLFFNRTLSFLEYLDISYAGLDIYKVDGFRHGLGSISASPFVPIMNNITITHGAYDALNLTDIKGEVHIANSTIAHNRGYGVFIKSHVGRTLINMTEVHDNWGDGVKMYVTNYTINEFNRDFPSKSSFCRIGSTAYPSFPIILHEDIVDQSGSKPPGTYCTRFYQTSAGKMITLHMLISERDPKAEGKIIVRDGWQDGPIILEYNIENGTFPQSVTTKTSVMWITLQYTVPSLPPAGVSPTKRCKHLRGCIRLLMELTTDYGPDTELRLFNTTVANNTGYGVNVQDVRSKVMVNSSVISDNKYGAGLRVYQGAAEIAVNNTRIERNVQSGVNITYSGGYQLFNLTTIANNYGYGIITEYLRLNRTRFEIMQKIEVVRSSFMLNDWTAFRIGNYCLGGEYLFNLSYFGHNRHEAIEYLSCNISTKHNTNFSMAFNVFEANKRHAVLMTPVVNTFGIFTNNTFRNHTLGVLRIDNGYDFIENRWYKEFDVYYRLYANEFYDNTGRYVVNLRLSQPGPHHHLEFKFNKLTDNYITNAFKFLNPRSKADAVIIASSGNVEVQRNWLFNPNSDQDIATHLVDPSVIILANYNWWGTREHGEVYERLFDQKNRYNLAELEYYPVLKDQWLYGNYDTSDEPKFRWTFDRGSRIGGVLDGFFQTDYRIKTYRVDRDIFVLSDSVLQIRPGTTLEFEPSVGMVVHGRLNADGNNQPIRFKLFEGDFLPLENRTIYERIRLVDGLNEYEGRLELNITGEFGTVCKHGWTEQNSALVCQQLGLTYNPEYGVPEQMKYGLSQAILLSHVQCDELDTDIFDCKAEHEGEFTCDHTQDVFLRCQPPTWSGVTIPAIPRYGLVEETRINHLTIERAGLLDFVEMSYTPAFRIDYNFYSMSYITVKDCVSDGINIKYSNPFSRNQIEHVTVDNNLGNGILTRSPYLKLSHMTLRGNGKAGLAYDPMFTEYEALSVRNFIYRNRTVHITQEPQVTLNSREMKFLTSPPSETEEEKTYLVEIHSPASTFRITVQVLDYNPLTNIEKVTFYDGSQSNWNIVKSWSIEEDLVDFPIVSSGQYLTLKYVVRGLRSGRLAFAVISSGNQEIANMNPAIIVYNATIQYNERGIVTKHYNNPSNEKMEIFHRAKDEEISFEYVTVEHSRKEAMFIPSLTKYHSNFIPTFEEMTRPEKVGSVTYNIKFSKFRNNVRGIHGEHNHVDFANNVWKWNVSYVEITGCEYGGFEIELPRVNDLYERQYHAVTFLENKVFSNKNFAFGVQGYYAHVNISNNNFRENTCRLGLITISGMEKEIAFLGNRLENNYAKYAVDFDLKSHSEYSENVTGEFKYNVIINNRNNFVSRGVGTTNTPVTYALAVQGVQNIVANKNVLENRELQYELVAGITSLSLENTLNVKENYWGTTDQYLIRERIFDFDDWNNFAIAEYFPFLSIPNPNGDLSNDQEVKVQLDLNHLGGRIWKDLTIPSRAEPYIVYSDLTVMPGVKFIIPPGAELQFHPNVGILVLGQLIASGLPYARIKFGPVHPHNTGRRRRQVADVVSDDYLAASDIRFVGGQSKNEGFLTLYNTTSRSWNIMCDNQLNEKTAEVVCRSMGLETVNVDVRFTSLYDYYVYQRPSYFLKEFWGYAYYCKGNEDSLDLCMKRINYNIKSCIYAANYTFIRCGERNLPPPLDYWGNIRFAHARYEEEINPFIRDEERSILQYVDIDGAGMLHGEKVGAIQTTYVSPIMEYVNITRCISNGVDVVAPRHTIDIKNYNISGNLGYAVNMLILNGDSRVSATSSFNPLVTNTVPYNLYGLVDICRHEKEIIVENRLILFYKYSQTAVDCVKIIHGLSSVGPKQVAMRFLQFSLYHDDFYRNIVEVFDGKQITDNNMLIQLRANSSMSEIKHKYESSGTYLTVHIHASPSYGFYGFIAEVVTIPLSGLTYPDDTVHHNIKNTAMIGNQDGALLYKNVGELTPSLMVDHCWIENNGVAILNLTSPPVIDIGLQSTKKFNLQNSFISRNKGGMYVSATTPSAATKLRANITNNVFAFGTNGEVMNLTGHHFEKFLIYENYIFNNTAGDYRDTIHVQHVVVNFTFNTITNNTGHYVVRTYNTELTEATQEYAKNLFSGNNATALFRSLFHVGSGNPKINHNYLVNEECDFELETNPVHLLSNGVPAQVAPIDATQNWWGSESTGYINGKIWDKLDNNSLVPVSYMPTKISNQSLIYGKCAPGWFLESNRCYKYMGAALPFWKAQQFCKENDGFLAESKGRQEFLKFLLRLTMNVYDKNKRVWVFSEVTSGRCSAFQDVNVVEEYDCNHVFHPFICEKDPYIVPPDSSIYTIVIAVVGGVLGLAIIIIIVLVCLWCVKSKKRSKERFERQSSIRSSVRGSTIRSRSTMSMLSGHSKRRLDQLSLSSSKYLYDQKSLGASQMSLDGVTEDDTSTDPREARRKLRQRAEIARGRNDHESPRYDRHDFQNGYAGGSRGRMYSEDEVEDGRRGRQYSEDPRDPRPIARGRPDKGPSPNHHTNGGYKYSDESQDHTERDSEEDDDDIKKAIPDSDEEEDHRNSFTPVKFKHNVEKELDSIRMKNNGSIQYTPQDDTGSIDMSNRNISRQMSSFSQHDVEPNKRSNASSQESGLEGNYVPTPPPSLPMNIPTKPQLRPVPAPRPKPLPSARSYGSREDITDLPEMKLNNLSQDEVSDYRGSRERLDNVLSKKAPSRENLNEPYRDVSGIGSGVEMLPRANKLTEFDNGRDSPVHTSRENLLPKRSDSDNYKPYKSDYMNGTPGNIYKPDQYEPSVNSSREPLYPYRGTNPGVEYMGRQTPQNTDYSDGTGIDYMPRDTRIPMKSRYMVGNDAPRSPYQPQNTGYQPTPPSHESVSSYDAGYQPRYPSTSASESMPYQPPNDIGVDYLLRNNYPSSPRSPADMSRSRENLSRSRENISRSRENLSGPREYMSRSRENLSRSRESLNRSKENLYSNYIPYDNDMRENSVDIVKPRQQKSIETEI